MNVLEDKSILTNGKRHMRTLSEDKEKNLEESKQLISEIKRVCEQLGWSQKELAEKIYHERNDVGNEEELKTFSFILAKQLQRPKTPPEKLQDYLYIISRSPEFKKSDLVLNKYIPLGNLSDIMQDEMLRISKELDKKLRDKEIEQDWEE
jgi:hypothetical protein